MFICVEAYDRYDSEKIIGEVPDELIAQALELGAKEDRERDELDNFLDHAESVAPWWAHELIREIACGTAVPEEDGTLSFLGEDCTAGMGKTKAQALTAYAAAIFDGEDLT